MAKKKLTRERLQKIIREEKQRLKRIKREAEGEVKLDESGDFTVDNELDIDSSGDLNIDGDVTLNESVQRDASSDSDDMSRLQELAGVGEEPEKKKTVTQDTLEMMDEVRDTITDRRVLEQLAKTIDDDTFRDALREIAKDENIQLY